VLGRRRGRSPGRARRAAGRCPHLFLFAGYVERFRCWGRSLRRAVASWYLDRPVDDVALQALTDRRHGGWSHRDLLRLAHPVTDEDARDRLFRWILGHDTATGGPRIVEGYQRARAAATAGEVAGLVTEYGLSWEMVPRRHLDEPGVWAAVCCPGGARTPPRSPRS
jgi:60 kDa SS-A/Ro ribonucleoprotein